MSTFLSGKFIQILRNFSEKELDLFQIWLKSPWANTNRNLVRLVEKLKKHHPDYNHRLLSKERLFKQVMPGKKYSNYWINNLLHQGYVQAEHFLVHQALEEDELLKRGLFSRSLENKKMELQFFKMAEKNVAEIEAKEVATWEDLLFLFQTNRQIYHYPTEGRRMTPGLATIRDMDDQLDLIYALEKAVILNEKMVRNRLLRNENHDIEQLLNKWRVISDGIQHPAIQLFRQRFEYTEKGMVEEYFALKEAFYSKSEKLDTYQQRIHLMSLINDTAFLKGKGLIDIEESFSLYKLGLDSGVLQQTGMLTRMTYITIVTSSNHLKEFEFTQSFIKKYTSFLALEIQNDAFRWATAHTFYRQKEFKKSLAILTNHPLQSKRFVLLSKILTAQTHFDVFLNDLSYYYFLINFLNSFEKWVHRESDSTQAFKNSLLLFIQKCKWLIKIVHTVDYFPADLDDFLQEGERVQAINWLRERREVVIAMKR